MTGVKVTQEVRMAALPIMQWLYCDHGPAHEQVFAEQMMEGDNDDHLVVQVIAKAVSEARSAALEEAAKVVESPNYGLPPHKSVKVATAIRSRSRSGGERTTA